jgi:hypothetical protein
MNRPRPVLTANGVAGAVHGIVLLLGFLGYANAATSLSGEAQGIGGAVAFLVPLAAHLLAGNAAQKQVTPNSSPMAADGVTPLVPVTSLLPTITAAAPHDAAPASGPAVVDLSSIPDGPLPVGDPTGGAHAAAAPTPVTEAPA